MHQDNDVVIIGGGILGTSMALSLSSLGIKTTIFEKKDFVDLKKSKQNGRCYALSSSTYNFFSSINVTSSLDGFLHGMKNILVYQSFLKNIPSSPILNFDSDNHDTEYLGYVIEDEYLRSPLLDACEADPNITIISARLKNIKQSKNACSTLTFHCGRVQKTPLVIGADGAFSMIKREMFPKSFDVNYHQTAFAGHVLHSFSNKNVAHEYFFSSGALAILPLGEHRSSYVLVVPEKHSHALSALKTEKFTQVLQEYFGNFLGKISMDSPALHFPLRSSLAKKMVLPNVALVGDAARSIHPIAGQGLNYGIRDVAALSETLFNGMRRGKQLGDISDLEKYERWRRFDSAAITAITGFLPKIFELPLPGARFATLAGMSLIKKTPLLNHCIAEYATGTCYGEIPLKLQRKKHESAETA
jgi:2-octaprenyl-6-methoxyphenol hydroxylase